MFDPVVKAKSWAHSDCISCKEGYNEGFYPQPMDRQMIGLMILLLALAAATHCYADGNWAAFLFSLGFFVAGLGCFLAYIFCNVVGQRVLLFYVDEPHYHVTKTEVRDLIVPQGSVVFQLRIGGWFRSCRVLHSNGEVDEHWSVEYWMRGGPLVLQDRFGGRLFFDAHREFDALRLASNCHSGKAAYEMAVSFHRKSREWQISAEQLAIDLLRHCDVEFRKHKGRRSEAVALFREELMRVTRQWLLRSGLNEHQLFLTAGVSREFVEEWDRQREADRAKQPLECEPCCTEC